MKGTILDFLKLATEKPELAAELAALARKDDFGFSDEVSDEELDDVAGGGTVKVIMSSLTGGGLPDGMTNPTGSSTPSSGVPLPYPNTTESESGGDVVIIEPSGDLSGPIKSSSGDIPG